LTEDKIFIKFDIVEDKHYLMEGATSARKKIKFKGYFIFHINRSIFIH
jgi:hypothetical protein